MKMKGMKKKPPFDLPPKGSKGAALLVRLRHSVVNDEDGQGLIGRKQQND